MKASKENSLFILDRNTANKLNDMLYKIIDAYWEILHDRQIDLPRDVCIGSEEADFCIMRQNIKNAHEAEDLF